MGSVQAYMQIGFVLRSKSNEKDNRQHQKLEAMIRKTPNKIGLMTLKNG
jgi:hypothetical protein